MKVKNSLKSLRARHRDNRLIKRKGRLFVINKNNKRFKARQG
tara:strand:- start:2013 stop:2138 length:126 start_codon:yes stop_codon:yes gene_type:complete